MSKAIQTTQRGGLAYHIAELSMSNKCLFIYLFIVLTWIFNLLTRQYEKVPYLFGYKTGVSPLQNDYKYLNQLYVILL